MVFDDKQFPHWRSFIFMKGPSLALYISEFFIPAGRARSQLLFEVSPTIVYSAGCKDNI